MNKRLVAYMQGAVLLIEAACMTPALVIALFQQDGDAWALGATMLILIAIGAPLRFLVRPGERNLRAREGFLTVALAWIALSCFGALPFVFSGMIPNYIDALFESVSGFTTTGATVLENFDNLPQGIMFWRSFTHWIGGLGVLVLTLALVQQVQGIHLFFHGRFLEQLTLKIQQGDKIELPDQNGGYNAPRKLFRAEIVQHRCLYHEQDADKKCAE